MDSCLDWSSLFILQATLLLHFNTLFNCYKLHKKLFFSFFYARGFYISLYHWRHCYFCLLKESNSIFLIQCTLFYCTYFSLLKCQLFKELCFLTPIFYFVISFEKTILFFCSTIFVFSFSILYKLELVKSYYCCNTK